MDYHNIFAREQLLEVAKELNEEISKIKSDPLDDDHDIDVKDALKDALRLAVNAIYKRIEALQDEQK